MRNPVSTTIVVAALVGCLAPTVGAQETTATSLPERFVGRVVDAADRIAQLVARRVPETIIDVFEAVNIGHDDRQHRAATPR